MRRYERSEHRWWNKPLVRYDNRHLPAELVVLAESLDRGEDGAWLNSRGTETGVSGLEQITPERFKTLRTVLPRFVQECLVSLYDHPKVLKGVYDLVVWREADEQVRFIEVKNPHWDQPTPEQLYFADVAAGRGIRTEVIEWEFVDADEVGSQRT